MRTMRLTSRLSITAVRLHLLALCVIVPLLPGCAVMKGVHEPSTPYEIHPESTLERKTFPLVRGSDVIGKMAVIKIQKGDNLPDIARHFSLGINEISSANPGVDVWVPKAGERIGLPLWFILPDTPRKGIVINLATMRLFQYKGEGRSLLVMTYPVGVGTSERPTPTGQMLVVRKVTRPTWYVPASIAEDHRRKGDPLPPEVQPGPLNPLGDYALYLSKSTYLIHGTNKPASIGLNATNGCLRLYPEDIRRLYEHTPINTPVSIVNQPYLVGQRGGTVYLEAHAPTEGADPAELDRVFAKLKSIEAGSGIALDWKKVEKIMTEARGIPVPLLTVGTDRMAGPVVEIRHPEKLYGKPEIPELTTGAWYVWAADLDDKLEALRISAIINHQGPQIPARVFLNGKSYRVITGPFKDASEAGDAAKRLKFDLEIDGVLIEPAKE
jgi:L,D-transpeptidase ErfK/SrfK